MSDGSQASEIDAEDQLHAASLGAKLRQRRKLRGKALQSVADAAGISVGLLSQIERGLTQPSLRSLRQICNAMEMPMSWLFESGEAGGGDGRGIVIRKANRRSFDLGPGGVAKQLMSPDTSHSLQMMSVTIPPGGQSGERPYATGNAARCGVVISGRLGIDIDGDEFALDVGDSFTFENKSSCRFWCIGDTACEIVWAVSPAIY